ncbi:2-hydroxyacid dehydrogenase [Hyphomonas jannaschiana]|nr:glyoxylate/hydroxypyruvate reductase A [Hyphomonas jannaschiana]
MMTHRAISILCVLPDQWRDYYLDTFRERLPQARFFAPEDAPVPEDITYAFVLQPPHGYLARFPNLKAIMPVGAGVEHVLADDALPDVPVIRMIQPDMAQRMSEYIVQHALNHLRRLRQIQAAQARSEWKLFVCPAATEVTVGILGLGRLGTHAAGYLSAVGFRVRGWSRTPKPDCDFPAFAGRSELPAFLSECDVLVSLLPLTPDTSGLIDQNFLSLLTPGASIINASRGGIIRDEDLMASLNSGHISEATLDAFAIEPLPASHPYWSHPKVTVTPHCASAALAEAVADRMQVIIETIESGGTPSPVVDRASGY